jgi:hypothetical protein
MVNSTQYTQDERDEMQRTDEELAWVEARMFRFPFADGSFRVVMKDTKTLKVVGDYFITYEDDVANFTDADAIRSRVGERANDSEFKKTGWLKPKDVRFNTLTHQAIIQS